MTSQEFMIDGARRETMRTFARERDITVLSASAPDSASLQEYASSVGGEVWNDPLRPDSGRVIVIARNTPVECRYQTNKDALDALRAMAAIVEAEFAARGVKKVATGPLFRLETADAFGNSPNRNGWTGIVIDKAVYSAVEIAARKVGVKLYNPICSDIYGVLRLVSVEQQAADLAKLDLQKINRYKRVPPMNLQTAFGITEEDVESVLRQHLAKVADAKGRDVATMAGDFFSALDDADLNRIARAALDSGTEIIEQTDGAYAEIAAIMVERGVLKQSIKPQP